MNALLIYPEFPDTFWSFRHALKFIGKKSAFPPLGLLTISSMLPKAWHRRLVDINVCPLTTADLKWADVVFASARSEEHTSELQSHHDLVCRLLLEKKNILKCTNA